MDRERKQLRTYSIGILVLMVYDIYRIVMGLFADESVDTAALSNTEQQALTIITIILAAVSALLVLIQLYLGVKGLMEARDPSSDKKHILLARILGVLFALGAISAIGDIFKDENMVNAIIQSIRNIALTFVLFAYSAKAKNVRTRD